MQNFDRSFLFGIILDVPPSTFVDSLKENFVKFVVDRGMMTRIFIYYPNLHYIPRDQGESVYNIVTYKESDNFSIESAFKSTVTLLGEHNEDCEKRILLITDRFLAPKNYQYRKGFLMNSIRGYDSKIIVLGMPNCDRLTLETITKENDAQYLNLEDATSINSILDNLEKQ